MTKVYFGYERHPWETPVEALLRTISGRLSRRIANENHGERCANCMADRELVEMAQAALHESAAKFDNPVVSVKVEEK